MAKTPTTPPKKDEKKVPEKKAAPLKAGAVGKTAEAAELVKETKPRRSAVPRASAQPTAPAKDAGGDPLGDAAGITDHGRIAARAYHKWQTGTPGGELDHWLAAERELAE